MLTNSKIYFIVALCFICRYAHSQVYSDKIVGEENEELSDSIKHTEYPFMLPIWGKKVSKLGFDLPYSAGVSAQFLWQRSELVIKDLKVGFNNGPQHDLDEIIRFNNATAEATGVNVRPDIWIFPFLDVYGIFAQANSSTSVDFSIWLPHNAGAPDGDWQEIVRLKTKASFKGNTTTGFGATSAIGVGGGFLSVDMNFSWTDVDGLARPVYVFNFGPRFGKSFRLKKPQQTVAIWVGAFRVKYANETDGSLPMSEFLPGDTLQNKIAQGQQKVNEAQQNLDSWWNSLSLRDQNNPTNIAKYDAASRVITTAGEFLDAAASAAGDFSKSTVQYSIDKNVKNMWNFVIGSQFQLNKHWMVRGEFGFLGTRKQFVGGLQYRFGL